MFNGCVLCCVCASQQRGNSPSVSARDMRVLHLCVRCACLRNYHFSCIEISERGGGGGGGDSFGERVRGVCGAVVFCVWAMYHCSNSAHTRRL